MNIYLYGLILFIARLLDVSIGSIRTILLVKGKSILAALFAFLEIIIWFYAVNEALLNNDNIIILIFYALGYAFGTYFGSIINDKYIKGYYNVLVVTSNNKLVSKIKNNNFGISNISLNNKKLLLFIIIKKKDLKTLKNLINSCDKNAFIIINETKDINNGYINI